MQAFVDNPFDCCQQWSYIGNTVLLYNYNLARYSFQSCWRCHCCHKQIEKEEDDGYDVDTTQKKKKEEEDEYDQYELKFRHLSAVFWDTKHNRDLITCGKQKTKEEIRTTKKQQRELRQKEIYKKQQVNIEMFTPYSAKQNKTKKKRKQKSNGLNGAYHDKNDKLKRETKKTREKRVNSDSMSFEKQNGKIKMKSSAKHTKYKYNHIPRIQEDVTDEEELNVLMPHSVRYQHDSQNINDDKFEYPRGI